MPSLITSYYGCSGQRCLSGSILAPVGNVADELIAKFMAAAKAVRLGDGLDEKTSMGPVVSAAHKQRGAGLHREGHRRGREAACSTAATPRRTACRTGSSWARPSSATIDARHDHRQGGDLRAGGEHRPLQGHERGGGPWSTRAGLANAACIYTSSAVGRRRAQTQVQGDREPSMNRGEHRDHGADVVFPFGGAVGSMSRTLPATGRNSPLFAVAEVVIERWLS